MNRESISDHRSLVRVPLLEPSPLNRYRMVDRERRERHEHLLLHSEVAAGVESNLAVVFGPIPAERFFDMASRFFGDAPYVAVTESETAADVEACLQAEGWALDEEEVAMVLTGIPDPLPPPPPGLRIESVDSEQTYEDFMQVVPGNRGWVPSPAAATDPDVGLFVGYVNDEPVVTSRLTCYGNVAEITSVQTLEPYRRRGYGRAMTRAAIIEAKQRGCPKIMLTATEMGHPLYLGMGFHDVCTYRAYVPPDPDS